LRRGWRPAAESVQFPASLWLDLEADEETLLRGMHPKTRYNIRLAERKGVTVRPVGPEAFDLLYDLYAETARRDRFVIRPRAYYRQAWGMFYEAGCARPLLAEVGGEPVAMVILYRFGPTAWYFYGASRDRHRDKMPNHRLQWEAIRWARSVGCRRYDFWGAPAEPVESDPMWGVYRFKRGFGGRYVRFIGTWDYPVRPLLYRLYTELIPRYLAWLRRRYWRRIEGGGPT
jgi:lipid II:glycine glycyltransferase (peptidoglycan interpeptide bridge formation enzyme)